MDARPRTGRIDVIGLSLITLGLGCLQIMMDRGEDDDWFGSNFILLFAALAALGILGAIAWLLYEKRPVVNIRVLGDRNFAMASILMAAVGFLLYGSAVAIPQLAQQVLGYDATLAGLVLSPGAALLIILIPIVERLQRVVPTKYIIATGFFILGSAMFYSHRLTPNVSFNELVIMRAAQAAGLAFCLLRSARLPSSISVAKTPATHLRSSRCFATFQGRLESR